MGDPEAGAGDLDRPVSYARRVGERLRAIRKQKGLSMQDVEAASKLEFRPSVLGAYERGERSISVPRLQRLARVYNVAVDQLLPDVDIDLADTGDDTDPDGRYRRPTWNADGEKITIDLTRLETLAEPEAELLRPFLAMIQMQRRDFNGRMLSIRRADMPAIACLLRTDGEAMLLRLGALGLRVRV